MNIILFIGIILSLFIFSSCGDDKFKKVEVVDSFRILAIVANEPEVAAGGSTNVFPYVSDPNGAGRTLSGTYEICLDSGVSFGANPTCENISGATTGSYTINFSTDADFAANGYTGLAATPVVVTVPSTIFSNKDSRQQFNGVAMLVIFRFTVDGKEISAFKRIFATNRGSYNINPSTPIVELNGSTLSSKPIAGDRLTLSGPNDEETFDYQNIDGAIESRVETYEVAWYVSSGKLLKPKISKNEDTQVSSSAESSSSFFCVSVVRDERGGVSTRRIFLP